MPSLEVAKNGCLPFVVKNSGVLDILKINKKLIISESEKLKDITKRIIFFEKNVNSFTQISKDLIKRSRKYDWNFYASEMEKIIKNKLNI